jgi:hypothetical protein
MARNTSRYRFAEFFIGDILRKIRTAMQRIRTSGFAPGPAFTS